MEANNDYYLQVIHILYLKMLSNDNINKVSLYLKLCLLFPYLKQITKLELSFKNLFALA